MEILKQIYPILFGIIPLLSLYSQNCYEAEPKTFKILLAKLIAILLAAFSIIIYTTKNIEASAMILLLGVVIFYNANILMIYLFDTYDRSRLSKQLLFSILLIVLYVLSGMIILFIHNKIRGFGYLPLILTGISFFAILLLAFDIINKYLKFSKIIEPADSTVTTGRSDNLQEGSSAPNDNYPDIYHIVLDSYTGFNPEFGAFMDNSKFNKELENRGFKILKNTYSNYRTTHESISSFLNMQYLDKILGKEYLFEAESWLKKREFAFFFFLKNEVASFLKHRGYKYIFIQNNWLNIADLQKNFNIWNPGKISIINKISIADNIIKSSFTSLWARRFVSAFIFPTFSGIWYLNFKMSIRRKALKSLQYDFENILKSAQEQSPKYVYSHLMAPHTPYMCNEAGEIRENKDFIVRDEMELHVEYVKYINSLMLSLIDKLKASAKENSIIIVHSDHGYRKYNVLEPKYNVLNAIYLPDKAKYDIFPEKLTLVNFFRYIFNAYFDTKLDILPDKISIYNPENDSEDPGEISRHISLDEYLQGQKP